MFEEGNIVALKSGGPKMVVTRVLDCDDAQLLMDSGFKAGDVMAQWFSGGTMERNTFKATSLTSCE